MAMSRSQFKANAAGNEEYASGSIPPSRVEDWAFPGHLTVIQNERLIELRTMLEQYVSSSSSSSLDDDLKSKKKENDNASSTADADTAMEKLMIKRQILKSDAQLLRFLRARDFTPKKAFDMVCLQYILILFVVGDNILRHDIGLITHLVDYKHLCMEKRIRWEGVQSCVCSSVLDIFITF